MTSKPLPASNFAARIKSPHKHSEEDLAPFRNTPWCQAIIASSSTSPVATPSLEPKRTSEDALFATLLRGNHERYRETILSCISYRRHHGTEDLGVEVPRDGISVGGGVFGEVQGRTMRERDGEYDEVLAMVSVGNGLDGHEGILHGGFIAMVLDEVMGMAGGLYADKSTFTASLKLDYRNPIPTPGIILVKAKVDRREGRKCWIRGSIEDGKSLNFAEAEGLWIDFREQKI